MHRHRGAAKKGERRHETGERKKEVRYDSTEYRIGIEIFSLFNARTDNNIRPAFYSNLQCLSAYHRLAWLTRLRASKDEE